MQIANLQYGGWIFCISTSNKCTSTPPYCLLCLNLLKQLPSQQAKHMSLGDLVLWETVCRLGSVYGMRNEDALLPGCIWGQPKLLKEPGFHPRSQAGSMYDKEWLPFRVRLFMHPISTLSCIHSLFRLLSFYDSSPAYISSDGTKPEDFGTLQVSKKPHLWIQNMDFGNLNWCSVRINQREEFPWLETESFLPGANISQRRRPWLQIASHAPKILVNPCLKIFKSSPRFRKQKRPRSNSPAYHSGSTMLSTIPKSLGFATHLIDWTTNWSQ